MCASLSPIFWPYGVGYWPVGNIKSAAAEELASTLKWTWSVHKMHVWILGCLFADVKTQFYSSLRFSSGYMCNYCEHTLKKKSSRCKVQFIPAWNCKARILIRQHWLQDVIDLFKWEAAQWRTLTLTVSVKVTVLAQQQISDKKSSVRLLLM